ncbi:MAG: hypothetical protein IT175_04410 [Acidobacteria bacterium]|nr:hypothetical protein [Acidobacteriota bacterium]
MSVIPCEKDPERQRQIEEYAEALKAEAHRLGAHGMSEDAFYESGLFRGAIERIRGQFSATMLEKREFVKHVLNYMQDRGHIVDWDSAGENNRFDYTVHLTNERVAAIELKGCLDGNNTNIFERPQQAHEFVLWSICTNPASDPRHNVWSGLNTRLSAEIITRQQRVDGVVVWDMLCGSIDRPCPKLVGAEDRVTTTANYVLPPPCLYVFPATTPHPRNNRNPTAQSLDDVRMLKALHECFGGRDDEVNYVDFDVEYRNADTVRRTRVRRGGQVVRESRLIAIRRS